MDAQHTQNQIERFEGRRNVAYADPLTKSAPWTIGVGHTGPEVHEGLVWGDSLVQSTFDADFLHAWTLVQAKLPWAIVLSDPRQAVLVNMCFQMGIWGLLAFRHALASAQTGDFQMAHDHMLDSEWARQTPGRAVTLATQMLTGVWQS